MSLQSNKMGISEKKCRFTFIAVDQYGTFFSKKNSLRKGDNITYPTSAFLLESLFGNLDVV